MLDLHCFSLWHTLNQVAQWSSSWFYIPIVLILMKVIDVMGFSIKNNIDDINGTIIFLIVSWLMVSFPSCKKQKCEATKKCRSYPEPWFYRKGMQLTSRLVPGTCFSIVGPLHCTWLPKLCTNLGNQRRIWDPFHMHPPLASWAHPPYEPFFLTANCKHLF